MADETYEGQGLRSLIAGKRQNYDESKCLIMYTNGTDIKAGRFVTRSGESNRDIALAKEGDPVLGLVVEPVQIPSDDYINGDTAFADDTAVRVAPLGIDVDFSVIHEAISETLNHGDRMRIGSEAGKVVKAFVEEIEQWTDYIEGNVSEGTELMQFVMPAGGKIIEVRMTLGDTGGTSGDTIIDVNIDGTTIFTTQGNRPTIANDDPNGTVDVQRTIENDEFDRDSIITVDVDEDTGGTPQDLTVQIVTNHGTIVGRMGEQFGSASASDDEIVKVNI